VLDIAFLAQTGQSISVLVWITWEMIDTGKRIASRHGYRSLAIVEIPSQFPKNRLGEPYRFVVGSDTMRFLEELPRPHVGRVFKTAKGKNRISPRTVGRIVHRVARECGIQGETQRKFRGWKWYVVHPDAFRKYWKHQMWLAGLKGDKVLDYMLGQRVGARDVWTDADLLRLYNGAKHKLAVQ